MNTNKVRKIKEFVKVLVLATILGSGYETIRTWDLTTESGVVLETEHFYTMKGVGSQTNEHFMVRFVTDKGDSLSVNNEVLFKSL